VFAITQVTTLLSHDLTWGGFGRAMLALALVWWAWSAFVWAANAQDPDAAGLRAALLVGMILIFVAGLALPHAFGDDATLFALTYAGVRFLHLGLYADASRRGNASWTAIAGFAVTIALGMGLLIAGSFVDGDGRVALWALAAAIDYAGPAWLTRERLRGLQQVAVAHFAERYSLFIIICLGESIVAIGVGASGRELDTELVAAVTLALLITVGMWWTYFDSFAATAEERLRAHDDPVLAAADAYSYIHLVLVAGIIVFAVGAGFSAWVVALALTGILTALVARETVLEHRPRTGAAG
jgi:low temperature requirement protein LtrA